MQVENFMTKNPITISKDKTVKDAAEIMVEKGISVLPVTDDSGALVGVLTESDFIGKEVQVPHALASIKQLFKQSFYFRDVEELYQQAKGKKIEEVMTKNVKTLEIGTSLNTLVDFMMKNNLKRVPILEDNKLVGIITRKDMIKAFTL